jgi:ankyrin repeat protein
MLDDSLPRAAENGDTAAVLEIIEESRRHAPEVVFGELQLALMWAATGGHESTIIELVKQGADVTRPETGRGHWPLIEAAREGRAAAVKLLIALGAPLEVKDHYGWTAEDRARMFGHKELELWLKATREKEGKTS